MVQLVFLGKVIKKAMLKYIFEIPLVYFLYYTLSNLRNSWTEGIQAHFTTLTSVPITFRKSSMHVGTIQYKFLVNELLKSITSLKVFLSSNSFCFKRQGLLTMSLEAMVFLEFISSMICLLWKLKWLLKGILHGDF